MSINNMDSGRVFLELGKEGIFAKSDSGYPENRLVLHKAFNLN